MKRALWITCGVRGNAGDALLYEVTRELFRDRIDLDFRAVSDPVYLRPRDPDPTNVIIGPGGLFVQTNSSRHLHNKLAKQWDRFEDKPFHLWSTGILQAPTAEETAAVRRVTSRARRIVVRARTEAGFIRSVGPVTSPEWAPCTSLFADRLTPSTDAAPNDTVVLNLDAHLFTPENIADHPLRSFVEFARAEGLDVRAMVNASGDANLPMLEMLPLMDIDEEPFGDILRADLSGRAFHDRFNAALAAYPSFGARYSGARFAFGKRLHGWLPFLAYDRPAAFIGMQARRGMPRDYFGDDDFLCDVPRGNPLSRAQLEQMAAAMIDKLAFFIAQEDELRARIAERREELWSALGRQADAFAETLA